jgi:hypothetical protein
MSAKIRTTLVAALLLFTMAGLGAACGSTTSDGNGTAATGGLDGDSCTVGGDKCTFCSATVGCADCLSDGDCGVAAPRCVLGRCSACADNADCGAGQACFPMDHQCHPKCTSTNDCHGPDMLCDTQTGECVGCIEATDCPADRPLCVAETGQCSECAKNADCPITNPACDLADGHCEQCNIDSDCEAGFACDHDHHCKSSCSNDSECTADHPRCLVSSGDCVDCLHATDCGAAEPACVDNRCVQCAVDVDCRPVSGEPFCDTHRDQCVECLVDANCGAPLPACNDDSQCPAGMRCKHDACETH